MKMQRLFNSPYAHAAIIIILGLLAYSNTIDVPFQWDDRSYIKDNPIVRDLAYFASPTSARGLEHYDSFRMRYAGYLTFAINYRLGGLDPHGFHVLNIAIHLLNALLVYLLAVLTFNTPFLARSKLREHARHIALFVAALFVAHPVQTEAVTYIFQRLTSLAAFFYLLSLCAYAGSRLSNVKSRRWALYAVSLLAAAIAMKTKENAFTLPAVITLYEFSFLEDSFRRRLARLAPILLTMLIVPLSIVGVHRPIGDILGGLGEIPRGAPEITRAEYLLTEFRVVLTYLRLLVLPVGQNIDYDYAVSRSLLTPGVPGSFAFIMAALGTGAYLFYRSRQNAALRLISFGILWFFITLSVESSVIPIPMVINEYRLYLPGVGVFMAAATAVALILVSMRKDGIRNLIIISITVIPLVLAGATYARNRVWRSETALWEDVVHKSPLKPRGHNNLGLLYATQGRAEDAFKEVVRALELDPSYPEARLNLGLLYLERGEYENARRELMRALELRPGYVEAERFLRYSERAPGQKAVPHGP